MPIGPVAAGIPGDTITTGSAREALPSEAAKTDGGIVVAGKDKNWHNNKDWNNKNCNNKKVVVVPPYRHWNKRPYYGTIIGGVTIGTILGAAAYSAVAPAPNLCWYWAAAHLRKTARARVPASRCAARSPTCRRRTAKCRRASRGS